MRTTLAALAIYGILVWFCSAQPYGTPGASKATAPDNATPGIPNAEQAAAYVSLNRREIESNAQFELLNQLAQEHKKRAEEAPADQAARSQWEAELAKELGDRAAATQIVLNNTSKERVAFENTHPGVTSSVLLNSVTGATNGPNLAEIAFITKLAERRADVEQELAATLETAKLYAIQLATNTSNAYESTRVTSLLQENSHYLKQLQKELLDLDLKNLEFRALSRH